jgi:hypothetical protein
MSSGVYGSLLERSLRCRAREFAGQPTGGPLQNSHDTFQ